MNISDNQQILAIAKHIFLKQIKRFTYWIMVFLPIIVMVGVYTYQSAKIKFISNMDLSKTQIENVVAIVVAVLLMMLGSIYADIMANEIANDKTSRIMEFLIGMSSAKNQLYGKFLGVYSLVILHLSTYIILLVFFINNSHLQLVEIFKQSLSVSFILYLLMDVIVVLFVSLIWSSEIASFITDRIQIGIAVLPVVGTLGTGFVLGVLFSEPGLVDGGILPRIILNVIVALPPLGPMMFPSMLISGNIGYVECYINLIAGIVIGGLMFKQTLKQYQAGIVSYSHENPFIQALNNELSFKKHKSKSSR